MDIFGYSPSAGGAFFCGWLSHPWPDGEPPRCAVAHFEGAEPIDGRLMVFYHRDDVRGRGIGFILYTESAAERTAPFVHLELQFSDCSYNIRAGKAVRRLPESELRGHLRNRLLAEEDSSSRRTMLALLSRDQSAALPETEPLARGFVDFYGYHSIAGGWLFCGWVSNHWQDGSLPERATISFESGDIAGQVTTVFYHRPDISDVGQGIIMFVEGPAVPVGGLCFLRFEGHGATAVLSRTPDGPRLRELEVVGRLRPILMAAPLTPQRDALAALLARQGFAGVDTLSNLTDRVFLEVDEAILCEPDGLVLMGWFLAKRGVVRNMRLRSGHFVTRLDPEEWVTIERPDVLASAGLEHGYDDPRVGFIAFLPHSIDRESRSYLEVETSRRELGFRTIPTPKLEGIAAIKRLLQSFDLRFVDIPAAYDRVIGPAVEMLNRSRLRERPSVSIIEYGNIPPNPQFSVIIPVYGRLDFVEIQLALFSAYASNGDVEYIYVLDDPPKRKEAQFLFASAYARFRIPFRALLLDKNVGFAPANNIGLGFATGSLVAFVNSDIFPGSHDWLERLAKHLAANPQLGAVGPLLLYEDGSVQHQGMYFQALREFGGWYFGEHTNKGRRYTDGPELQVCTSITGACILMKRSLAQAIGGFDEAYVIGDFEDSDLCLKLRAMGLECAVDPETQLYHLERKSQVNAAQAWRMNMTLYNAWIHQHRWATLITDDQSVYEAALAP